MMSKPDDGHGAAMAGSKRKQPEPSYTVQQKGATATGSTGASLPLGKDMDGEPCYVSRVPGLDARETIMCADLIPHIPYLYYSPPKSREGAGTKVYQNAFKGDTTPIEVQFGDHINTVRFPFGMKEAKAKGAATSTNPNIQNLHFTLDNDATMACLTALDTRNIAVGRRRMAQWFPSLDVEAGNTPNYRSPIRKSKKNPEYKPTCQGKVTLEPYADREDSATSVLVLKEAKTMRDRATGKEYVQLVCEQGHHSMLLKPFNGFAKATIAGVWFMSGTSYGQHIKYTEVIIVPPVKRARHQCVGARVAIVGKDYDPADADAGGSGPENGSEQHACGRPSASTMETTYYGGSEDAADSEGDNYDGGCGADPSSGQMYLAQGASVPAAASDHASAAPSGGSTGGDADDAEDQDGDAENTDSADGETYTRGRV